MTDLNNIGSDKLGQIQNLNFEGAATNDTYSVNNAPHKEIKNLDNAHAALVGRSMIKKMEKIDLPKVSPETLESIKSSVASFKGNEKAITASDAVFNAAVANGVSYEDAAKLQQVATEHFKEQAQS